MSIQKSRDGDVPVYQVDLDEFGRSTSCVVVERIAELTDQDPETLDPLWECVDPEALDSFVDHASESSAPCQISFRYEGYTVTVIDAHRLQFTPTEETLTAPKA
jgi:hypothetical protein